VDILRSVVETIGYHFGRQTVNKRSPQGFVATLPVELRVEEEFFIRHSYVSYTV